MQKKYKYEVAISFAEEDRNAALALALALELKGVKGIYYYPDQPAATAGKKLDKELKEIYSTQARYTVILFSKKYFKKRTAGIELQAIYDRILQEPEIISVIPIKLQNGFDLTKYPYLEELTYLDWGFQPKIIAEVLLKNLGANKLLERGELLAQKERQNISIIQVNNSDISSNQRNDANIKF